MHKKDFLFYFLYLKKVVEQFFSSKKKYSISFARRCWTHHRSSQPAAALTQISSAHRSPRVHAPPQPLISLHGRARAAHAGGEPARALPSSSLPWRTSCLRRARRACACASPRSALLPRHAARGGGSGGRETEEVELGAPRASSARGQAAPCCTSTPWGCPAPRCRCPTGRCSGSASSSAPSPCATASTPAASAPSYLPSTTRISTTPRYIQHTIAAWAAA